MKIRNAILNVVTMLVGAALVFAAPALAGKKDKESCEKKEQMEKNELGAPAEMGQLAFLEGEWDVTTSFPKDDGTWTESHGISTYRMILEGAVLEESFKGEWGGKQVTALSWVTFNRQQNVFEEVTVNSLGAKTFSLTNGELKDGKLVLYAEHAKGDQVVRIRRTMEIASDDKVLFTLEYSKDGEEWHLKNKDTFVRRG